MEIPTSFIVIFYICLYFIGIFYALAGEYLGKSNDICSPFFTVIGVMCLSFASRKIAHTIYSTIDNKQFVLVIVIMLFAFLVRYIFNEYIKYVVENNKINTLDSVLM